MKALQSTRTRLLIGGVCIAALAGPAPALAQDTPARAVVAADDNVILVTATKREEDAQDVPIAITALDADLISSTGITGTEDLRAAVPALNVTTAIGGFGLPRIRGVGATGQGAGIENPVAVYVDGVYYAASFGNLLSLKDAEQVAVLKGPQGTLFGRNATGGLIQITTRGPTQDLQASGSLGFGNFNTYTASGFVSGGLSDTLAMSVSGQYSDQRSGFGHNIFTGNDVMTNQNYAARAKIRWEPTDTTSILLQGDVGGFSGANPAFRPIGLNTAGQNVQDVITAAGGDPLYDIYADVDPHVEGDQWGASLTIDQEFGSTTLRSITAYRHTALNSYFDPDGRIQPQLIINNNQLGKQWTQEINLISDSEGSLNWVLGGFYMHDVAGELPYGEVTGLFTFGNNGYNRSISRTTLESFAGFAEVTYAIGDATNVTGGLRYTHDARDLDRYSVTLNRNIPGATPVESAHTLRDLSYGELTWKLSLDHRFSDELMAYASYNRGFRSGAFVVGPTPPGELTPERVNAYEVGVKTDLADGRIRINIAGYYYDQSSVQVMQIISGVQNIYNAGGAEIYGLDADVSFEVTDNLRFFGGVNIVEAKYKSFTNGIIATPFPLPSGFTIPTGQSCLGTFGNPFTQVGGNCLLRGDASGNQLQNTPNFTSSAGFTWDIPTSVGVFSVDGNWYHNSGYPADIDTRVQQPSYNLLNASLTWRSSNESLYVRAWGRNLANEYYYSQLVS